MCDPVANNDFAMWCGGPCPAMPNPYCPSGPAELQGNGFDNAFGSNIEDAGGTVLSGMCFYQSYAREIAEANGWRRLATNSAKLVNILGGYGYQPVLASMEACVDAAVSGRLAQS